MSAENGKYNGTYRGDRLDRIAFPLGGMGAGMVCLEGAGALSHVSVRHKLDFYHKPCTFSAVCIKGETPVARVLEGPVPKWKIYGYPRSGAGSKGMTIGLPRFGRAQFSARFPFASIELSDDKLPLDAVVTGWSPFIPRDADNSSLPVAALEYAFTNTSKAPVEAVYSFNTTNFMSLGTQAEGEDAVRRSENGFTLYQAGSEEKPWQEGAFNISVLGDEARVNALWFRGGWFDPLTMAWKDVATAATPERPAAQDGAPSPGGSLFVPFALKPGDTRTVTVLLTWYVPGRESTGRTDNYTMDLYRGKGYVLDKRFLDPRLWDSRVNHVHGDSGMRRC